MSKYDKNYIVTKSLNTISIYKCIYLYYYFLYIFSLHVFYLILAHIFIITSNYLHTNKYIQREFFWDLEINVILPNLLLQPVSL